MRLGRQSGNEAREEFGMRWREGGGGNEARENLGHHAFCTGTLRNCNRVPYVFLIRASHPLL